MCGICGIISDNADFYHPHLDRMINSLRHRGPDGSGISEFGNCILGHTRLSIVDLKSGDQPMHSAVSPVCIVFNGEIYGYQDIRKDLKDYPFASASDTEVILALYEKEKEKCVVRLPGMFAFAIWDEAEQVLFAARDRFGEKPLYYAWGNNHEFIFASEIKAILATGLISPILCNVSLKHYLQYLYVHPASTIYENIFTLPPAHVLTVRNGTVHIERYWRFPVPNNSISMDEAIVQFQNLFEKAIKNQMIADVPVGAFLSGGLDSSTVVAVASRYNDRLQTFSFGFEEAESELPYAHQIADKYKTDHHDLSTENVDIAALLTEMSRVFDEPFADSSNIPTYLISKRAREHLKVILSGDGGDELLGGYSGWYYPLLGIGKPGSHSASKYFIIRIIAACAYYGRFPSSTLWMRRYRSMKVARTHSSYIGAYSKKGQYFTDHEIEELFLSPVEDRRGNLDCSWDETNTMNDALMMDLENYMPGDILVKTDRASMAHGLELRTPFLDRDFASFCISLPSQLKITKTEDKIILRRAYEDLWTEDIRKRDKMGFGAPVIRWLKQKNVKSLKEDYLNNPDRKIFTYLSFEKTRKIRAHDTYKTWILLVLSIWMEEHDFLR